MYWGTQKRRSFWTWHQSSIPATPCSSRLPVCPIMMIWSQSKSTVSAGKRYIFWSMYQTNLQLTFSYFPTVMNFEKSMKRIHWSLAWIPFCWNIRRRLTCFNPQFYYRFWITHFRLSSHFTRKFWPHFDPNAGLQDQMRSETPDFSPPQTHIFLIF